MLFLLSLRFRAVVLGLLLFASVAGLTAFALFPDTLPADGAALSCAAVAAFCLVCLVWLLFRVLSSVKDATACLARAAEGDLNSRLLHVRGSTEVSGLKHAINRFLDISEAFLKESEASLAAAEQKRYYRRFIATGMPGIFGKSAQAISHVMLVMDAKEKDYEKRLKGMINTFDSNITRFLTDLFQAGENLKRIADRLDSLSSTSTNQSEGLSRASDVSSSSVEIVVSTTEELSASIREIGTQVTRASQISAEAVRKSLEASESIANLQNGANKIGDIVHFIGDIASQTNLLALNATIEAARAGEAGKGFAVVAAEVKGLATKTAEATTEISSHVSGLLKAIETTVSVISDIGQVIQSINQSSASISAAMEEQEAGVQEILRSMQSAAESVRETQAASGAIMQTAKEVETLAGSLGDAERDLSGKGRGIAGELDVFLSNIKTQ